jgi:RNA polymerase sigma-70 factor (ECF subfamily)
MVNSTIRPDLEGVASMKGAPGFATTNWDVVLEAGQSGSPQFHAALEELCRTYWLALYSYLRRDGYDPEDAEDVTQGFFLRLLRTNSLVRVSPLKGRFRSFLLASLKHYASDERDRSRAKKRGGTQTVISLEGREAEASYLQFPSAGKTPEQAFDQYWAMTVLEEAFQRLRYEYLRSGREHLFECLSPFLSKEGASDAYAGMARELRMSEAAIAVAVHRLRQRYRECLRFKVGETVTHPDELKEEMRYLFSLLAA